MKVWELNRKKQNVIFSRFETVMEKNLFNLPNTGIGLSLVKELVELHHGDIIVNSKIGKELVSLYIFIKERNIIQMKQLNGLLQILTKAQHLILLCRK